MKYILPGVHAGRIRLNNQDITAQTLQRILEHNENHQEQIVELALNNINLINADLEAIATALRTNNRLQVLTITGDTSQITGPGLQHLIPMLEQHNCVLSRIDFPADLIQRLPAQTTQITQLLLANKQLNESLIRAAANLQTDMIYTYSALGASVHYIWMDDVNAQDPDRVRIEKGFDALRAAVFNAGRIANNDGNLLERGVKSITLLLRLGSLPAQSNHRLVQFQFQQGNLRYQSTNNQPYNHWLVNNAPAILTYLNQPNGQPQNHLDEIVSLIHNPATALTHRYNNKHSLNLNMINRNLTDLDLARVANNINNPQSRLQTIFNLDLSQQANINQQQFNRLTPILQINRITELRLPRFFDGLNQNRALVDITVPNPNPQEQQSINAIVNQNRAGVQRLVRASYDGNLSVVQGELDAGTSVYAVANNNMEPNIHHRDALLAATYGHIASGHQSQNCQHIGIVTLLLSRGASPRYYSGATAHTLARARQLNDYLDRFNRPIGEVSPVPVRLPQAAPQLHR